MSKCTKLPSTTAWGGPDTEVENNGPNIHEIWYPLSVRIHPIH